MSADAWETAKKRIETFNKGLQLAPVDQHSTIALAEIARQLINLNANLNILSDVNESGLNRIADSH